MVNKSWNVLICNIIIITVSWIFFPIAETFKIFKNLLSRFCETMLIYVVLAMVFQNGEKNITTIYKTMVLKLKCVLKTFEQRMFLWPYWSVVFTHCSFITYISDMFQQRLQPNLKKKLHLFNSLFIIVYPVWERALWIVLSANTADTSVFRSVGSVWSNSQTISSVPCQQSSLFSLPPLGCNSSRGSLYWKVTFLVSL